DQQENELAFDLDNGVDYEQIRVRPKAKPGQTLVEEETPALLVGQVHGVQCLECKPASTIEAVVGTHVNTAHAAFALPLHLYIAKGVIGQVLSKHAVRRHGRLPSSLMTFYCLCS